MGIETDADAVAGIREVGSEVVVVDVSSARARWATVQGHVRRSYRPVVEPLLPSELPGLPLEAPPSPTTKASGPSPMVWGA